MTLLAVARAYETSFARQVQRRFADHGRLRRYGADLFAVASSESDDVLVDGWQKDRFVGEYVDARVEKGEWRVSRDPAGVRPAYWTATGGGVAASTDPDILLGLGTERSLNRPAAIDHIVAGNFLDDSTTALAGLHRIPPGHLLSTASGGVLTREYTVPETALVRREPHRVVSAFWSLFVECVADRAVGDVVVMLSGGIDSSAMAAALVEAHGTDRILAVTYGPEGHTDAVAARAVADYLGIEWRPISTPSYAFEGWPARRSVLCYPIDHTTRVLEQLGAGSRIFYGGGGDTLLSGDPDFWEDRLRRREWLTAARELLTTTVVHGLRPGVRASLTRPSPPPPSGRFVPPLLARLEPEIEHRLQSRYDQVRGWRRGIDGIGSSVLGGRYELVQRPDDDAPFYTSPYLDHRLISYVATVPLAPWFIGKEIMRAALRGRIPEEIRTRPKTTAGVSQTVAVDQTSRELLRAEFREPGAAADIVDVSSCLEFLERPRADLAEYGLVLRAASVCRLARLTAVDDVGATVREESA